MDPMYIYEDYELDAPWVILIGVGMDVRDISQAPASFENPTAGVVVAKAYNRAARACREFETSYFPRATTPKRGKVLMLPPSI